MIVIEKESSWEFSVHFEGSKFNDHSIEVNDITKYLQGLKKIIKLLMVKAKLKVKWRLEVTANPKEGSVILDLILVLGMLPSNSVFESAKSVMEAVSILIDLIKQYHGKSIPRENQKVIFNNCKFEIGSIVNSVYEDPSSQKIFIETFSPIKGCDFGRVRIKGKDGTVLTEVTWDDLARIDEYRRDMNRKLKQEAGTKRGKTGNGKNK